MTCFTVYTYTWHTICTHATYHACHTMYTCHTRCNFRKTKITDINYKA